MKLEKNPDWTWKTDLKYYILLPFATIWDAIGWFFESKEVRKYWRFKAYMNLGRACLDVKLGRIYIEQG